MVKNKRSRSVLGGTPPPPPVLVNWTTTLGGPAIVQRLHAGLAHPTATAIITGHRVEPDLAERLVDFVLSRHSPRKATTGA
jgi:hypothetical protein